MLYASTRASVTKELGDPYFVGTFFVFFQLLLKITESLYGSSLDEFTMDGYRRFRQHCNASAPLTDREAELKHIKHTEVC
jgi:twinfilin-like protein